MRMPLANRDAQQLAVGATYAMSRKLDFYAAYTISQLRQGIVAGNRIEAVGSSSALNVGMRHSF